MLEINFINQWFWFALTAGLVILEIILGTSFFLLWLAFISFAVGILVWATPQLAYEYQILIFALGSILSIFLWRLYLKKHPIQTDKPNLNRRSEQLVGKVFTLTEPIVNGVGKIHAWDTTWRVEGPDLPVGSQIKVVGADGVTLKVKPHREE